MLSREIYSAPKAGDIMPGANPGLGKCPALFDASIVQVIGFLMRTWIIDFHFLFSAIMHFAGYTSEKVMCLALM